MNLTLFGCLTVVSLTFFVFALYCFNRAKRLANKGKDMLAPSQFLWFEYSGALFLTLAIVGFLVAVRFLFLSPV